MAHLNGSPTPNQIVTASGKPPESRAGSFGITPGKHCVLLIDQAGWHIPKNLVVPATITIVPSPAKCSELKPVENVWQFMRDNWLSKRVFASYAAIVYHRCNA